MTMQTFLLYWGPSIMMVVAILIPFGFLIRAILARQAKFYRDWIGNGAAQTAELSKIHQSLERLASAIEADKHTT